MWIYGVVWRYNEQNITKILWDHKMFVSFCHMKFSNVFSSKTSWRSYQHSFVRRNICWLNTKNSYIELNQPLPETSASQDLFWSVLQLTCYIECNNRNLARTEKYFQYFFLFVLLIFKVPHSFFLLHCLNVTLIVFKIDQKTREKF